MSEEAPAKKDEGGGAPAWVMTFADLMSLLMCFFVLLLSFSEMDLLKFKQIAGSMKAAFGVQRDIKAKETPKGTSIIAREFSPGRPTPTLVKEVRQSTIDETKQTLEHTDAMSENEKKESIDPNEDSEGSGAEVIQRHQEQPQTEKIAQTEVVTEIVEHTEISAMAKQIEKEGIDKDKAKSVKEEHKETVVDAHKLLKTLEPEIEQGLIAIKTQGNRILLRINEKGSFPSGSSIVKGSFLPVLNKLRKSLNDIEGKIVVAGHTDNIPIKTARFRSNWELSSSRAVTVVHELLELGTLSPRRFVVEGRGEAYPLVPNDSTKNRALNRRVELTIVQNEDDDAVNEISAGGENPFAGNFNKDGTEKVSASVQDILDKETAIPDQTEKDAVDLQTLKDRFEAIRQGLQAQ